MKKHNRFNQYFRMAKLFGNCLAWLKKESMYVLLSAETAKSFDDKHIEIIYTPKPIMP
jgi:hypothetical protein